MSPIEILQEFNSCYLKIQAIAQNENWQKLIADKKIDPEAATHLGDTFTSGVGNLNFSSILSLAALSAFK
ncbi:MAG: hypothetical protein V7K27_00510 [Nostoc sp.]|uniref:hypothetical protein n=1 Tax=Nostoc sp. TaxID=1180 RepID=UPI002FF966A5